MIRISVMPVLVSLVVAISYVGVAATVPQNLYHLRHRRTDSTSEAHLRACSPDSTFIDTCIDSGLTIFSDAKRNIPPDPNGAAGLTSLIAVTNAQIEGLRKDGTTIFAPTQLSDMFSLDRKQHLFDPKIVYDVEEKRFVVVMIEDDSVSKGSGDSDYGTGITMSRMHVAASKNGDPVSAGESDWYFLSMDSFVDNMWCDYPGLAVDEEAIYITGNSYGPENVLKKRLLWVVPKSALYSGNPANVSRYDLDAEGGGQVGWLFNPALVRNRSGESPGLGTYLLSYDGVVDEATGQQAIGVIRIQNPLTDVTFNWTRVPFGHLGENHTGKLPWAPQKGSEKTVDTGTNRVLKAVWVNNSVWLVFHNHDDDELASCWVKLDTNGVDFPPTLADEGCIRGEDIGPGTFTYYPSLDVNSKGVAAFGFAASSSNMYAGAFAAVRDDVNDPPGVVSKPEIVREGEAAYNIFFGDTKNRWGDYTGMSLDPSDDDCFWAFNQYAARDDYITEDGQFGSWKTAWARLCYPPKKKKPTDTKNGSRSKRDSGSSSRKDSRSKKGSTDGSGSQSMKASRSMKGSSRSRKGSRRG